MAIPCGIDLGTTYSAISWYDEFNRRVETLGLSTADGMPHLRSVVYYPGEGEAPVVGDSAWNAARNHADRVIVGIKREMGTGYKTPPIDGKELTPEEISSEILKVLVADGQAPLGEEIRDAVITVPAYFGDNECAATRLAGEMAGLNVLGLMPEPHAAALAFSIDKVAEIADKHLLVYDLGGGTFDVTLVRAYTVEGPDGTIQLEMDTLCKEGNVRLGGLDWDKALANLVMDRVLEQHGVDLKEDLKNLPYLMDNCERAKRELTRKNRVVIVAGSHSHEVEVTREEFEDCTRDLFDATRRRCESVLEQAEEMGVKKDQIEVLLAGGASRMPAVEKLVEDLMGKKPIKHKDPSLLVTIGAAYKAHLLTSEPVITTTTRTPEGPKETKVKVGGITPTGFAVGVLAEEINGGSVVEYNSVIVPNGAAWGQEFERVFQTTAEDMTEIALQLYEGNSRILNECRPLMTFSISGLPSGRPAGQLVKITMGYDQNGVLRGTAEDVATNTQVEILIDRSKPAPAKEESMAAL